VVVWPVRVVLGIPLVRLVLFKTMILSDLFSINHLSEMGYVFLGIKNLFVQMKRSENLSCFNSKLDFLNEGINCFISKISSKLILRKMLTKCRKSFGLGGFTARGEMEIMIGKSPLRSWLLVLTCDWFFSENETMLRSLTI
jgi:hypothetical protein